MQVSMNQVIMPNRHSENVDLPAGVLDPHIGMAGNDFSSQKLESWSQHIHIPDRSVGDDA